MAILLFKSSAKTLGSMLSSELGTRLKLGNEQIVEIAQVSSSLCQWEAGWSGLSNSNGVIMTFSLNKGNGVSGKDLTANRKVLQDLTKPTYEEMVAQLAAAQKALAEAQSNQRPTTPTFKRAKDKEDGTSSNYFQFFFNTGSKGLFPYVQTTPEGWRILLSHAKQIEDGLKAHKV